MLNRKHFMFIAFCFILLTQSIFSQIVLQGTVIDNGAEYLGNGAEPVVNARVRLIDKYDSSRVLSDYTDEQGHFEIQITESAVGSNPSESPSQITLFQNYPNPFNPSTVISFKLKKPSFVKLVIYNVQGQKVRTLLNGYKPASLIQVDWNATNDNGQGVSAGLYIYSLNVNGHRVNKKMLLIDGQQSNIIAAPVTSNSAEQTVVTVLNKQMSDQYLLRVTGHNIAPYEQQNLEITGSMAINVTVMRTVTDIDGNVYSTVKIGDQWWMKENLKVTRFNNGDSISYKSDLEEWEQYSQGYCAYNNDINNVDIYGYLYNWYAVDDPRGLAPLGWHVPSNGEWTVLGNFLGGNSVAGGKLKEEGAEHWFSPNTGATNESGFTALPGGGVDYSVTTGKFSFQGRGATANFWSSSPTSSSAYFRFLGYDHHVVGTGYVFKREGMSVRCVKDTSDTYPPGAIEISPMSIGLANNETQQFTCIAHYSNDSTQNVTYLVTWSTSPGTAGSINSSGYFTAHSSNTGTETVTASYQGQTAQATVNVFETGSVTDIDGNIYRTVKIGNQWWMAENLKVTHYRNGDPISNVTNSTAWYNYSTGAYCAYDNDENNADIYGYLYNWNAVADTCKIAPEGWHVPSDEEWKELEMVLGMSQSEANSTAWRGNIGYKLKATSGWEIPGNGTNLSGFSALPGGYRFSISAYFGQLGRSATFWTSTEQDNKNVWHRYLQRYDQVNRYYNKKIEMGMSVRCVKDTSDTYPPGTIEISPMSIGLANNETQQFTCLAHYSNDSTQDVTYLATWSTSPETAGSINSTGYFTAHSSNTGTETVTASYQGQTAQATVYVTGTAVDSLWKATTEYYPETANIDSIVQAVFGPNYRVADWDDMVSCSLTHSIEEWANNIGMIYGGYPASGFLVKSGGNRWWSGNRHYWVERHNHVVPNGWLVHDQIDNHFIDLGSWYSISLRILCIRTD